MRFQDIVRLDSKQLGARIREARERIGLSQEELAAAVSKDQGAISEYESGKRKLSATELPLLAETLHVSLLYFYEGEVSSHDLDQAMLREFHQLASDEAKQSAIEIVRIFSSSLRLHSA